MKKYKKVLIGFGILLCLIIIVHRITYTIDKNAINNNCKPKFASEKEVYKDGGTTVYYGFGYQIIYWNKMDVKKENNLKKYGVMVGVETHTFPFYNNVAKGGQPQIQLNFIEE